MTLGKKISIGIIGLIAIPLIVALFLPTGYQVERTIDIAKPASDVFDYIRMLKNQDQYSVWAKKDPSMKKIYTGVDGSVGFISRWESMDNEVGTGEQEIKMINVDALEMQTELRFIEPMEATEKSYMKVSSLDQKKSKVIWGFEGSIPYPSNLICLFMNFEELIGKDFEEGLSNLKVVLEK
ncbi:SRPBCC family protein [Leptospira kanakyensis]|uniref:Polyketide cyclase n=1 Tax=Leptospira kanakyensis TaxID=2484968 RepID=A0A6N4PXJ3_9LEPT|nr:SRPBCC family protein [Leptospira kanakyensis]MCW7468745.1 SRPBCC family protein [Leptospira kanakyensis]MCW7479738.1 SRPBCC family protein [Leptospira kanakyensis]TGK49974.1 polyketide cyclase [Leptospira kanakyensis]TGK58509.1 polyketide cyclase [Leptospira kanakyensis]TGK69112.1 polyketide cyclase [Leptospira kanakyensis]